MFKSNSTNSPFYDIPALLSFWQKYLLDLKENFGTSPNVSKSMDLVNLKEKFEILPTISKSSELMELLPKKYQGQINRRHLETMFIKKCAAPGLYEFIWLYKSPIGSTKKVIRQLESVFQGKPQKGNLTFIPFSFSHSVNGIEHLVFIITFEKL